MFLCPAGYLEASLGFYSVDSIPNNFKWLQTFPVFTAGKGHSQLKLLICFVKGSLKQLLRKTGSPLRQLGVLTEYIAMQMGLSSSTE